ncbi:hypothetical protein HYQ46_001588 [Verticillium longisporum]|nr:hypothetical protein HYQ46_001588 [Verticillium longisporum]
MLWQRQVARSAGGKHHENSALVFDLAPNWWKKGRVWDHGLDFTFDRPNHHSAESKDDPSGWLTGTGQQSHFDGVGSNN